MQIQFYVDVKFMLCRLPDSRLARQTANQLPNSNARSLNPSQLEHTNPGARLVSKSKLTFSLVFRSQHNQPRCPTSIVVFTMSDGPQCPYCGRKFKNEGGLRQHVSKKKECHAAQIKEVSSSERAAELTNLEDEGTTQPRYCTRASLLWKNVEPEAKVMDPGEASATFDPLRSDFQDHATPDQEPMDVDPYEDIPDDTSQDPNQASSDSDSDDATTSYGVL